MFFELTKKKIRKNEGTTCGTLHGTKLMFFEIESQWNMWFKNMVGYRLFEKFHELIFYYYFYLGSWFFNPWFGPMVLGPSISLFLLGENLYICV